MKALHIAGMLYAGGLLPGAACAQDALKLGDVHVVQSPQPAHYQPDSTDYDLADRGKTFQILCTVAEGGHMQDCTAQPNNLADQNFVRIGTDNARYFVIGAEARDGTPTVGRILSLTCQFNRTDDGVADAAAVSAATGDRASTDVAVNDR